MAEELQDADIWLYPTKFDEISCVAAMEAAAAGCKCVSTDHAALAETLAGCPGRTVLTNDNTAGWGQQLREAAETTIDRYAEMQFAVRFDMDALAAQWVADLLVKPATVVTDEEIVL
jgi:glycosyltransferase involved in cell wall biosynthesis